MLKIDKLGKTIYDVIRLNQGITLTGIMMKLANSEVTKDQIKTRLAVLQAHNKIETRKETRKSFDGMKNFMVTVYYIYY